MRMSLSLRTTAMEPNLIEMIEPTSSSVTRTGPKSTTAKVRPGRSGKRPSLDNLRALISRKEDKTHNTPESSGTVSNGNRQRSAGTPGQPKGYRSGHGQQSSRSVMTGPLNEEQRHEWYKDDNLNVRLRLNGLVSGSGLGEMRAGHPVHHSQRLQSPARVKSRS